MIRFRFASHELTNARIITDSDELCQDFMPETFWYAISSLGEAVDGFADNAIGRRRGESSLRDGRRVPC